METKVFMTNIAIGFWRYGDYGDKGFYLKHNKRLILMLSI